MANQSDQEDSHFEPALLLCIANHDPTIGGCASTTILTVGALLRFVTGGVPRGA